MLLSRRLILVFALLIPAFARNAPTPATAPGGAPNIFYGGVHHGPDKNSPVLLFVHGLSTNAAYWYTKNNDMYNDAYNAGYRTAFVSLSADNSDNTAPIAQNAAMLQQLLPEILAHFNTTSVYLICHSKGGLDAEDAMLSPAFLSSVKMVFTVATPNQGAALADWAYGAGQGIAGRLGILSPGLYDLQTSVVAPLRATFDPLFLASGIPFFTFEGTDYSAEHNIIYDVTGRILASLTNGQPNDGLVAEDEVPLPLNYAQDIGQAAVDHTHVGFGSSCWSAIAQHLPPADGR